MDIQPPENPRTISAAPVQLTYRRPEKDASDSRHILPLIAGMAIGIVAMCVMAIIGLSCLHDPVQKPGAMAASFLVSVAAFPIALRIDKQGQPLRWLLLGELLGIGLAAYIVGMLMLSAWSDCLLGT